MSKVNITGRSNNNRTQPVMRNIPPPRTELGQKILEALRPKTTPEQDRVLASIDYSGAEIAIAAQYAQQMDTRKRSPEEKRLQLAQLYGGKGKKDGHG